MTGWDIFEVSMTLLVGTWCMLEGVCYKQLARKHLIVLKDEYRYGRWQVRAAYVFLGLLLILLGVLLTIMIHAPHPLWPD